jgi:PRTRC genetic system protein B
MDNIPRVTVTLTDEACWITRHDRSGAPGLTYPAAITDICNAFNRFGASTGLLPVDTLFWSAHSGVLQLGVYLPPARRAVTLHVKARPETLRVPLPGLLFVGEGTTYKVFAVKERPTTGREALYHVPLPNVHLTGDVCAGTVQFPVASSAAMAHAVELFFDSLFNSDLSGGKVRSGALLPLLRKLSRNRSARFPAAQLVSARQTVNGFIAGDREFDRADDPMPRADRYADADGIDPYELAYGLDEDDDDED